MRRAPAGRARRFRHSRSIAVLLLAIASGSAAAGAPDAPALDMEADRIAGRIREAARFDDPQASAAALRAAADDADRLAARVDAESALWRRLQSDRLYALGVAADHAAAVHVYDTLRDAGHAIPAYAVPAAARALVAVSRRREAEHLLVVAQFAEPADPTPTIVLAEILADAGELRAARWQLERWLAEQGDGAGVEPRRRREAELTLARLERWDEAFAASQRRLDALAQAQADDPELLSQRAALERQRGRPRAALALLDDQSGRDAREIAAQAWLDLGRPDRAAALFADGAPEAVAQRIRIQRGSRGVAAVSFAKTDSSAINSPSGGRERTASVHADTGRFSDAWRIGAHVADRRADFQQETPRASYAGLRATRHGTGGETLLELGRSFDDFLEEAYAILDTGHWIQDEIRLAARLALNDPESPLQARASGIGSDALVLAGTYRPDLAWRLDAGIGIAEFDDGNRRSHVSLTTEHRLCAAAGRVTTGFAAVYAMRNTRDDAPYFNPESATTLELGLTHWVRGAQREEHRLRPSIALYRQDGFDTELVPLLSYRLSVPAGEGRWYDLDLGAAQPVYDGQRETRLSFGVAYRWGGS